MAINPEALDEYREILGEEFAPFFIDLIETFFSSGPEFIKNMKAALASGDDELFTRSAHTLKSNCKTFGAYDFAELAYELEMLGNDQKLEEAPEKLAVLEETFQQLVDDLTALKDNLV
jgi:HPt (histidine-containing phosphotransfer) domain-containing protein